MNKSAQQSSLEYTMNESVQQSSLAMESAVDPVESVCYVCALIILIIVTVFGNVLVCTSVWRFAQFHTTTYTLIGGLAIADLLMPVLREFFIVVSLIAKRWVFTEFLCHASSICGVILCSASILHLCAISLERMAAIKWPLKYSLYVTRRRVLAVMVYLWIQSILLALFPLYGITHTTFNPTIMECEIVWTYKPELSILLIVFYFLLPLLIMSAAYAVIFKEVQQQVMKISDTRVGSSETKLSKFRKEMKAVKTIIVVIGVFFMMWLPFFITTVVRAFYPSAVPGSALRVVLVLAYGNSACNPLIYSLMNTHLRRAFSLLLRGKTRNQPPPEWTRSRTPEPCGDVIVTYSAQ